MGRSRQDAGAKLMGHTMLRKNLVRNVESASIPQFLNESFDDVLGWLHWRVPRLANSILYVCQLAKIPITLIDIEKGEQTAQACVIAWLRYLTSGLPVMSPTVYGFPRATQRSARHVTRETRVIGLCWRRGRTRSAERVEAHLSDFSLCNLLSARCADNGRFNERRSLCRLIRRRHHAIFPTNPIS